MGINKLLTDIKLYYKILYCILILFYKRPKKIFILIQFNIIGHIKKIILTLSKIINEYNINLYIFKITIISYILS